MARYDIGLVCMNGHAVNGMSASSPEFNEKFCSICGKPTTDSCSKCGSKIRGYCHVEGFLSCSEWVPPGHCHDCGTPYPWTERRIQSVRDAIDELEGLSTEERTKLIKSIPDLIADTPNSETACLRVKKAVAKVGKASGEVLKNVLAQVATEVVKKHLGIS